ncbi:MAG: hypothetical protein L3J28_09020 [Candidatus Polarisedimenticolaceae bacterium]|nr:hypothetical protein [Candidatus Polarisedimenticolaceae bacterium]
MFIYRLILILSVLVLAACSEEPATEKATKPHLWQGQVDMLDEAKKVSQDVSKQLQERKRQLDGIGAE